MNCPFCGAAVPPGGAFCPKCGRSATNPAQTPQFVAPQGQQPPKNTNPATVLILLVSVGCGGIFLVGLFAAILFPVFAKSREKAREVSCESNVKQLELGLIEYAQDYKGAFPSGDLQSSLMPYVKNQALFHCPDDGSGGLSYSLNSNLAGSNQAKLMAPGQTVAIYEGRNQTLAFRHEGEVVVGFADGHVRLVSESQAQSLRWNP